MCVPGAATARRSTACWWTRARRACGCCPRPDAAAAAAERASSAALLECTQFQDSYLGSGGPAPTSRWRASRLRRCRSRRSAARRSPRPPPARTRGCRQRTRCRRSARTGSSGSACSVRTAARPARSAVRAIPASTTPAPRRGCTRPRCPSASRFRTRCSVRVRQQRRDAAAGVDTDDRGAGAAGSMIFGIGTRSNNGLGSALAYRVDDSGYFTTVFQGQPVLEELHRQRQQRALLARLGDRRARELQRQRRLLLPAHDGEPVGHQPRHERVERNRELLGRQRRDALRHAELRVQQPRRPEPRGLRLGPALLLRSQRLHGDRAADDAGRQRALPLRAAADAPRGALYAARA